MGTAGKMARAQEAVQKAGTLAEAQSILDQLMSEEEEVTDIFYTQQEMIGSLTDLLAAQDKGEVTYVQPPAPPPKSKNFLLYAVLGIVGLVYFRKIKL